MAETAHTEVAGEVHSAPSALGLDPTGWVALSMIAVFAIMLWKKVPAVIGAALDKQIAGIKEQLDAAAKLRADAEALKAEYEVKAKSAASEIEAIRAAASKEADEIVAQARADAAALIARRSKMAEEKIAAAERAAVAEVRTKAAAVAAAAAERLIAGGHDAKADKPLIDATIARLN
jgi:F-type H+-transporting ATPase subunit b